MCDIVPLAAHCMSAKNYLPLINRISTGLIICQKLQPFCDLVLPKTRKKRLQNL